MYNFRVARVTEPWWAPSDRGAILRETRQPRAGGLELFAGQLYRRAAQGPLAAAESALTIQSKPAVIILNGRSCNSPLGGFVINQPRARGVFHRLVTPSKRRSTSDWALWPCQVRSRGASDDTAGAPVAVPKQVDCVGAEFVYRTRTHGSRPPRSRAQGAKY